MRRNTLFNNHGLTLVEAAIAMLMLAIIFAGIGYMMKTVPIKQRAYHATTRDEDAFIRMLHHIQGELEFSINFYFGTGLIHTL